MCLFIATFFEYYNCEIVNKNTVLLVIPIIICYKNRETRNEKIKLFFHSHPKVDSWLSDITNIEKKLRNLTETKNT